jgi:hypothetical protein
VAGLGVDAVRRRHGAQPRPRLVAAVVVRVAADLADDDEQGDAEREADGDGRVVREGARRLVDHGHELDLRGLDF